MSLKDWLDNGWLKPHQTDRQEITNLLGIVERDLADAMLEGLSDDWKFGIAYNAALKLCTIMLFTQGYRPENALAHYRTIMALKEIDKVDWEKYAIYLNSCRILRNTMEYDKSNVITVDEATKIIEFSRRFHVEVKTYLQQYYPHLFLDNLQP